MKRFPLLCPRTIFAAALCSLGVVAALLQSGCSFLPEAKEDPTRFFLLSPTSAPAAEAAAGGMVIHLRPIELASYLRVRPLIVRRGNNEVEFREYARWGEPLEQGIARVLREELLARGAAAVQSGGLRGTEVTADLAVRVLAFEGGADGGVNFRAVWDLFSAGASAKSIGHGDFHPTNFRWDGKDEASLAGEFSKAVTGLADEIAAALPKTKT